MKSHLEMIHLKNIDNIRAHVGDSAVHFQLNETPDPCHRSVVDVLVAPLDGFFCQSAKPSFSFVEATNSGTIQREFMNACQGL